MTRRVSSTTARPTSSRRQAGAHAPGGVLEDPQLGVPARLRRTRAADQRAGGEDRAADREVEDDRRRPRAWPGRRCIAQPTMPSDQDADARDERERMKSRRPLAAASAGRAPAAAGLETGVHVADAASGRWRAGTSRRYLVAPGPPTAQPARAVGEGRRFGPRQPVRERPRGGVLGRQRAARRPATGCASVGIVPADPGLAGRVVGGGAEVLDLGRVRERREPAGERGRAPRTARGSSADASSVTTGPASATRAGCPTATMNARPATTRMSLPCGGSHWKWRPRTTPRAERDWLTCSNRVGRPEAGERAGLEDLREPAPLVAEHAAAGRRGPRGWRSRSTVNGTATSSPGRRRRRAPGR